MASDAEYLDILDIAMRMVDDARLAANANLTREEKPAAVLLDFLTRLELLREYVSGRIPDRWRVN